MLSEFDAAAAAAVDVPVVPAEAVEVVNYATTALANTDARRGVLMGFVPTSVAVSCHRSELRSRRASCAFRSATPPPPAL